MSSVTCFNLEPHAFAAVTSVAVGQGLVQATVDGSVPFTIYWTEVFGCGGKAEGIGASGGGARRRFVLLAAMQHAILAVLLEGWHGNGRSKLGADQGPDQSQIYHAYLKLHMLHVNGIIGRIRANLPHEAARVTPLPSTPPGLDAQLHGKVAPEQPQAADHLPQRRARVQSGPSPATSLPDGAQSRVALKKGR